LNAIRWNDWKVHFAITEGNIATAVRQVPGWPVIINLRADPFREGAARVRDVHPLVRGQHLLFVPVQQKPQGVSSRPCRNIPSSRAAA